MKMKASQGWVLGPVKDFEKKTHPDMIPYEDLPEVERKKDDMDIMAHDRAVAIVGMMKTKLSKERAKVEKLTEMLAKHLSRHCPVDPDGILGGPSDIARYRKLIENELENTAPEGGGKTDGGVGCDHTGIGLPGCKICDPRTISEGGPQPDPLKKTQREGSEMERRYCPNCGKEMKAYTGSWACPKCLYEEAV